MKVLLTGATGYIGKRLLPELIKQGHFVYCCVRDEKRFNPPVSLKDHYKIIEIDFLEDRLPRLPSDIQAAYYLMHSMSTSGDYKSLELTVARHFRMALQDTNCQQVIYLSGIVNEDTLSDHLQSRKAVENELALGKYHLTTLRAGIIIGSGSASFEIMRDLVEKLPLMVTPKWLKTRCQPIAIADVIRFLSKSLGNTITYDDNFDIGGPDILTYKEMLLELGRVRGLKRYIFTVPVMTPRLSSYWLYFVTSTTYSLASALVDSMKIEVICRDNRLAERLHIQPMSYREALERTFAKVDSNQIISSWKDSQVSGRLQTHINDLLEVPSHGCFRDQRHKKVNSFEKSVKKVWAIGGTTGWYYGNLLWRIRGLMDKMVGGVGLRRGRTNENELSAGDAVDFWRVVYANKEKGRLLLFAEMKLPGEAWLEFRMKDDELWQTATFRPRGLAGRLYWYSVLPFHGAIFQGMLRNLSK